jgi:hypothetical protein
MTKPTSEQVTFLAAGSGATQRTALDKLRDVVSVKDFGAVGNGVANDTAAFNAAWTASNPHPVYVPPGTYLVTGSVGGSFYSFGNVTVSGGSVPLLQNALYYPIAPNDNVLINGDFQVSQRGTTFTTTLPFTNNNDNYVLDRWYLLSDGNDIVDVSQNTANAPFSGGYCIALDVETVNKKFGIAQIVETQNCNGLLGQEVTLSFKARVTSVTKLDNVKCAIVAWSGTADSVTSDIVSSWNVENTNPTLIANATYENTPANLNVTTSWQTFSVTATVDTASANNIIVFIWSDVTDTTLGDFLLVTDVKLEKGSTATTFMRDNFSTELLKCQRYFVCSINTTGMVWSDIGYVFTNYALATDSFPQRILFRVPMRIVPIGTKEGSWSGVNTTAQPTIPSISTNAIEFRAIATANGAAYAIASGAGTGWYATAEM